MPVAPDQAIWFIKQLRHTKGRWAGMPFQLHPYEESFIRAVLKLNRHDRRIVRKALLGVARKNGKSELGAALALVLLILDNEPGGEVIGAAGKKPQAGIILETAKRMVRYSKIGGRPLTDFLVIRRDSIYFPELDARYYTVSRDAEKEHGLNPHAIIMDELHVQPDRKLWDVLETAQGARENPLILSLTTAGAAPKGLCWDEYRYLLQVLSGVINDPETAGAWYEADRDLAIDDPKAWEQANPGLDVIVSREWVAKRAQDVLNGRSSEYSFRRLQLNQWTTALDRWLPRRAWDRCNGRPSIPDGSLVYIAADAAIRRDAFGIAVVRLEDGAGLTESESGLIVPAPIAHVMVRAFTPPEGQDYIDIEDVRTYLLGLSQRFRIAKFVYDPAYMSLLADQLGDAGWQVQPYAQSPENMLIATELFQRFVIDGRLRHGADRTLDEHLAGVGVRETDRGVRLSKAKSGDHTDTVFALAMALAATEMDDAPEPFASVI